MRVRLAVLAAAVGTCASLLIWQLPASALEVTATPTPVTGNATYFDGLGAPYGGCGLPQANIDSQDFVALNVYNTPGDYTFYNRPLAGADLSKIGMWNNGHNCGRYVKVTIGDYCTGTNDGAQNSAFCRNGAWTADAYNGATLTMVVADSCGDSNAWCRDDPYHLDLSKPSLNNFVLNGAAVGDMYPNHWNNRHISWQFVNAPNYTGDIKIGFLQSAQAWWPAISVSHLANGIHSVEYYANGVWTAATMNGDMGQSYIIGGLTSGATDFKIRVRDVNDALINGGREYNFSLPASCGSSCPTAYTEATYTTSGGSTTTTAPASTTPASTTPASTTPASTTPASTTTASSAKACTATYAVTSSWTGGFQAGVTVKNTGTAATTAWTVNWTLPSGQTVSQLWNGTLTTSGSALTVTNASWNGALAAGGSTSFGFLANGSSATTPTLTCTAS